MDAFCTRTFNSHKSSSTTNSFQVELKAAVNERAVRNKVPRCKSINFNDDDDDDDDDDEVLNELLKTRRKKIDVFKSSRTKTFFDDLKLSDEDEENIRPKKVSFLKSQRNSGTRKSDALGLDTLRSDSLTSDTSLNSHQLLTEAWSRGRSQQDSDFTSHTDSSTVQNSTHQTPAGKNSQSESALPLYSENSQSESALPLYSENSQSEAALPLYSENSQSEAALLLYSENSQWESSSERVSEATPPTPSPRLRAPRSVNSAGDERTKQTQTPSSRAATPAISNTCPATCPATCTTTCTATCTATLQSAGNSGIDAPQLGSGVSRSLSTISRISRSASSSRYLGTLKVLEQRIQETDLDTADSLRAVVYQDWMKKKEEKLQATFKAKKQEERRKEEKKLEEEMSKKAEAKASFEAWKKKKHEVLREKMKQKHEVMRKLQKETNDEEERKETAKQVFEKWKREHDDLLRKQLQKQLQNENMLKEKKEEEKEQRIREISSSVAQWNTRKTELMEEKLKFTRRMKEIKETEEKYEKEERDRTALEMYEDWLKGKEFQQKQESRKKNMKTVLEEPTSPWIPPNRTVPFGK